MIFYFDYYFDIIFDIFFIPIRADYKKERVFKKKQADAV